MSNSATDAMESIKDALVERVTSPLLGAFFSFWLILNWKGLFFLLFESKVTISDRITYYEDHYFNYWDALGLPALLTVGFLGAYPLLAWLAHWQWKHWDQKKVEKKNSIEGKSTFSGEQYLAIKAQLKTIEVEHHQDKEQLEEDLKTLETISIADKTKLVELQVSIQETAETNEVLSSRCIKYEQDLELKTQEDKKNIFELGNTKAQLDATTKHLEDADKHCTEMNAEIKKMNIDRDQKDIELKDAIGEFAKAEDKRLTAEKQLKDLNDIHETYHEKLKFAHGLLVKVVDSPIYKSDEAQSYLDKELQTVLNQIHDGTILSYHEMPSDIPLKALADLRSKEDFNHFHQIDGSYKNET